MSPVKEFLIDVAIAVGFLIRMAAYAVILIAFGATLFWVLA